MFKSIVAVLGVAALAMLSTYTSLMITPVYAFGPQVTVGSAAEQVLDGRAVIAVEPSADTGDGVDGIMAKITKTFDSLPSYISAALALFVALNTITAMTPTQVDKDRQLHPESVELPLDERQEEQERRRHIGGRNEEPLIAPQIGERNLQHNHGPRSTSAR